MQALVCVLCRAALNSTGSVLRCSSCARKYPLLGNVPLLVADSAWYLDEQLSAIRKLEQRARNALAVVEVARSRPNRREAALMRMREGMLANLAIVARWVQAIEALAPDAAGRPIASDDTATAVIYALRYFLCDWGHSEINEARISTILASLRGHLAGRPLDAVAVLGGGAGRFGWELTRDCDQVSMLDMSAPMAMTYEWLSRGELDVTSVVEMNVREVADLYRTVRLRMSAPDRDRPVRPERATYAIADALRLPFADATQSAVLSIYLTDVVDSVDALMGEAKRVLKPGGAFIHFGTLGYGGYNPAEMWTIEELRELYRAHGFRIDREEWVEHPLLPANTLVKSVATAWSVVMTKQ